MAAPPKKNVDTGMNTDAKTLVLATRNAGKVRELGQILAERGLQVVGLDVFPELEDVEETGTTFEENALLKARYVREKTGLSAVADDSGLEVDALHGSPGVYSARYGADWEYLEGESKDQRNNRKLLHALKDVPEAQRQARFVCSMALCLADGQEIVVRGTWEGRILAAPRGDNGFGFDPLFFDEELQRAAAELTKDEKNARSHRGKAVRMLLEKWGAGK